MPDFPRDGGLASRPRLSARALYDVRRWRDAITPGDWFGEPAWDMLLELQIALDEGREVAEAALAANLTDPTTRAGLLERLTRGGMMVAGKEPDGWTLSPAGAAFMERVLGSAELAGERD